MEASSNILYTFPPILDLELEDEVTSIEEKCSSWSTEYHPSKEEIQKKLIERMVESFNLTAESPLKLVNLSPYEIARSSNPKNPDLWDWNSWNAKLINPEWQKYKGKDTIFNSVSTKIGKIIFPDIKDNWKEQVDTFKALQTQDGISPPKIYDTKDFFEIIRNYRQMLKPITGLIKGMISNGFLTRETINAVYSCVIDK